MATIQSRTALVSTVSAPAAIPALWDRLAWILFAGLTVAVFLTFQHYGITFDEEVQNTYGDLILRWYATRGADDGALTFSNLYLYGGLFDTLASLANLISPFGVYETRHLLNGLVGVIGVIGCWKLARVMGGPRAALFAATMLALTPDWYGQMFNNPKDIPFAAAMTWSTYFTVRLAHRLPSPPLALVLKLGLAIGLALGTRVGGVLLFVTLAFTVAGFVALEAAMPAHRARLWWTGRQIATNLWPVLPTAFVVMLVWWPWAQQNPIGHPLEALAEFSHFPMEFDFAFFGTWLSTTDLPWYYIPAFLAVKLPEPMVLLLVVAAVMAPFRLSRMRLPTMSFAFALFFPPVYIVATHAVLYDNIRHVLFLIPLLAVVAGIALDQFDRLLRPARGAAGGGLGSCRGLPDLPCRRDGRPPPQPVHLSQRLRRRRAGGGGAVRPGFLEQFAGRDDHHHGQQDRGERRSGGADQALYRGDLRPDPVGVILPAAGVAWRRCRG